MKSKLNPNARKWVRALRSGKYKQAREKLCKVDSKGNERFCCLGVACDLFIKSGNAIPISVFGGEKSFDGNEATLPIQVRDWLGINSETGDFNGGSLIDKNDKGASFKQIADIIEKNAETLFE